MTSTTKKRLLDTVERQTIALQAAGIGTWEWDLETDTVKWDPSLIGVYGYDYGSPELAGRVWEHFLTVLHPADRNNTRHIMQVALQCETEGIFAMEYRIRWPDGKYRYVMAAGKVTERDVDGRAVRLVGASWRSQNRNGEYHGLDAVLHRLHDAQSQLKV